MSRIVDGRQTLERCVVHSGDKLVEDCTLIQRQNFAVALINIERLHVTAEILLLFDLSLYTAGAER
jgi:hypothetical protein